MSLKKWIDNVVLDKEMKEKINFFREISIFHGLSKFDVGKLITAMYRRTYEPGEVICPEGEMGKALFIILYGEVAITKRAGMLKEDKVIGKLHSGDFFGEMSLLEEKPRTATVRALTKCEIYIIYKSNFDSMIEKNPRIGLQVIRNVSVILSSRLRGMMDQIA